MVAKKYRVLAADDEFWICENLRHMIPWQDYGLEFLEPAADGEEVLDRLKNDNVDILITDINMPYLDGLKLLKIINTDYPNIVTMVLSGYDDFPKVKGAFMEGSINYLLKPVSKSDLINTLSRAIERIGERKAYSTKEDVQRTQAQRVSSFLQDGEFSRMLLRRTHSGLPNIISLGAMDAGDIDLILLKFHDMDALSAKYEHDMLLMSYEIKKQIKEAAEIEDLFVFNYTYRINEFVLCAKMNDREQRRIARLLLELFPQESVGPVTVILGNHSFMMEDLSEAYQEAISVYMTRPFLPVSAIIEKNEALQEQSFSDILLKEEEKEVISLIAGNDKRGLEQYIYYHIGIAQSRENHWSLLRMRQTVRRLMNLIENTDVCKQSASCEILAQKADQEINRLNLEEVLELFGELFLTIFSQKHENPSDSVRDSIRKAIRYVDDNFVENVTLHALAEKFHVEPTYFSRLFRQESGENLIPYVAKKRMEAAVALMKNSELSLTEISFLVGYEDYGYFSRVFRKYKNCSPKHYRRQEEAGT